MCLDIECEQHFAEFSCRPLANAQTIRRKDVVKTRLSSLVVLMSCYKYSCILQAIFILSQVASQFTSKSQLFKPQKSFKTTIESNRKLKICFPIKTKKCLSRPKKPTSTLMPPQRSTNGTHHNSTDYGVPSASIAKPIWKTKKPASSGV